MKESINEGSQDNTESKELIAKLKEPTLKEKINNFLFEIVDDDMTIKEFEKLSCDIYEVLLSNGKLRY